MNMADSDGLQDQPRLPPELERLIFEMAADEPVDQSRARAAQLMRVAKRVREWVRPIFYSIFIQGLYPQIFEPDPTFPRFYRDPSLIKTVGELAKHLFIGSHVNSDTFLIFLHSCSNVQNFALCRKYGEFLHNHRLHCLSDICALNELRKLKLTVKVTLADVEKIRMSEASKNLTHLDIVFLDRKDDHTNKVYERDIVRTLAGFPKLTHLALNIICTLIEASTISEILAHCANLELLIIKAHPAPMPTRNVCKKGLMWNTNSHWEMSIPTQRTQLQDAEEGAGHGEDCRLVMMFTSMEQLDLRRDWEKGARGEVDSWVVAERYAEARRRNFFFDNSLQWIRTSFAWSETLNREGKEWYSRLPV